MTSVSLFPLAGVVTSIAALMIWKTALGDEPDQQRQGVLAPLVAISIIMTLIGLILREPIKPEGLYFGLVSGLVTAILLTQASYLFGLIRHGIRGLGLILLPATALPLLVIPFLSDSDATASWIQTKSPLQDAHLLISLLAYAVLTLATIHALMYLQLNRSLKRKQIGTLLKALPALTEIEKHMYAQILGAVWLLGIGILTGLTWQWNESAHFHLLTHKTLLAIFSWAVLMTLLIMRKRSNWSGHKGSIMVIAAYIMLLLAYFGVKFIRLGMN